MPHPEELAALRSILVATNLGDEALGALRTARALRPDRTTALHVVHSVVGGQPGPLDGEGWAGAPPGGADSDDSADLRQRLLRQLDSVGLDRSEVEAHLRVGRPHQEIRTVAEFVAADLIVLGTHSPRRLLDGVLGTTADRVIRTARLPCLVTNREVDAPPRRILVATDLSPLSAAALRLAAAWARGWAQAPDGEPRPGQPLHIELLYVFDFARPGYRATHGHEKALRDQVEMARTIAGPHATVLARTLSAPMAPEGILRAAEEASSDLVFMGTHGDGFFLRTLIGSVASEVIRTMRLPVIVVPPQHGHGRGS